jgi:PAS domain S-box-containing protein
MAAKKPPRRRRKKTRPTGAPGRAKPSKLSGQSAGTSTANLQEVLDLLPAPIFVYRGEKNILINPPAETLTRYTKEELLDMNFWEIVHPEFWDLIRNRGAARQRREAVSPRYEVKILAKSGEERWLDFTGGLIRLDGKPAVIGTVIDVTQRKHAEEQLKRQLQRMAALREISLAITSTLDLGGVLDVLLREVDLLLPYAATTVRLRNPTTGNLDNVACRNVDEKEWRREAGRRGGHLSGTILRTKAPFAIRNLNAEVTGSASEFFHRQGFASYLGVPLIAKEEMLGILSFFTREEHEFAPDEIEFLSTLANQAAVAIHNSRLYAASKNQTLKLEEANNLKNEFLGFVSHELRTPLNSMIGYAGMIQDEMFGATTAEQQKTLDKISAHAQHLLRMINSLLQATKVEVAAGSLESRKISLSSLLDELKTVYGAPLDKNLTLDWDYPDALTEIRTDREKLRHILQNLVDNAIKYTAQGRIAVSARTLPGYNAVEFTVTDTGSGIPPEVLSTVFDIFRQGEPAASGDQGGVGLGLHIAKKFTEMLGGTIEVESEVGKGSTFRVTIPSSP